ncbi:phage shock protein A (PspA) family protein [Bacillus sp. OV322]|uniref:PspA/IM30 family protein n=1 Tax=Bacillus sp. OV322 TaxID=1882764 RepID=UPI0008E39062|nr:PspA/IM30 family protein [Bacillus sp. OV322]SFC19669.1 phage shock protein A (PspA) family protein [Bacillus sp. OV322]
MNVFTRLKETIAADFHELLDQKEKKNPIAVLNQYMRQSEQETEKVRKLVERQYQLKEEFTRELAYALNLAGKRKHQAEVAAKAGETGLQEFAEREIDQYEKRAERLKTALHDAENQLQELEQKYEEMKHKLKDMNIKRLELMGRENAARAHYKINSVLDTESNADKPFMRFEEMGQYLERLEDTVNSSYHHQTIDGRIARLEKELKNKETHSIS